MELKPSKLGTKQYWDDVYASELENFEEIGDEGEVWFGEESVEKMVDWCLRIVPPEKSPLVLELGSGNGILLTALVENGYNPDLIQGIDYSQGAVQLAKKVAFARGGTFSRISYNTCDFLYGKVPTLRPEPSTFDLVLDKGTFDAIALAVKNHDGNSPCDLYTRQLFSTLSSGGYFLITSCNFTEEELIERFTGPDHPLEFHSKIQHQTFTFGGKSGSIVATVAFRKF